MIRYLRPLLTLVVTLALLIQSTYLVLHKMLDGAAWFTSWLQVVTMMIGFYFAERAQQKQQHGDDK